MGLGRRVIGGVSVITLAGVAGRLLSLLTAPVLSHLLSPDAYGAAALASTGVALASVLALLGIDLAYTRQGLQAGENEKDAVERFCWRFAAAGSIVVATGIALAWSQLGARWAPQHHVPIALFSFLAVILAAAGAMASTRVRLAGNYRRLASATLASAVVAALVSLGVALFWRADVWALLLGALSTSVTMLLWLGLPGIKVFLTNSRLPASNRRDIFLLGLSGSLTAPLYWVISSSDRWFLASYVNDATVGIYSVASSLALAGLVLNSSITTAWFPEANRVYQESGSQAFDALARLWERLVVLLGVAWLATSAAGGDALRVLTAPIFHAGAEFIPWLAGGVFFYGLAAMATTSFFLANRMRVVSYCWIVGGVFSAALNWLIVPRLGGMGAAIAQCASYAVIAGCISAASRKVLKLPINGLRLCSVLFGLFAVGVLMTPSWASSPALSLLLKFPAGLAVAGVAVFVVAPQWVSHAWQRARQALPV